MSRLRCTECNRTIVIAKWKKHLRRHSRQRLYRLPTREFSRLPGEPTHPMTDLRPMARMAS